MEHDPNLLNLIKEKIQFGQDLLESLAKYKEIDGIQKLSRKINQELNFLRKVVKNNNVKKEYLQCTNLTHFSALRDVLANAKNCISVNKVFSLNDKRINVDIVADNGLTWIKVIARNPKSLCQIYMGDAGYGVRSIVDQADEFLECAEVYPCLFRVPKIMFVFANGIDNHIAFDLESLGVIVKGTRLKTDTETNYVPDCTIDLQCNESESILPINKENEDNIDKVNLDVSAMIAYVSSLTNGHCNYAFKVPVLTQQAEWERQRPVKPILDELFCGKRLFCCETAKVNFDAIVNTVGGANEKKRAKELMKNVIVLADEATVADTLIEHPFSNSVDLEDQQNQFSTNQSLPIGGKIKQRSKIIFRFGDNIQAMTVTANDGFVRSAKQKGINFVVFVHESRALTEQKQTAAQVIK